VIGFALADLKKEKMPPGGASSTGSDLVLVAFKQRVAEAYAKRQANLLAPVPYFPEWRAGDRHERY
jgi:hypothetical protein